ncbi:MAG: MFS transporter [Actinobacteria bacterium]|nr:MFS transporter [Actinomycetota bacterium]
MVEPLRRDAQTWACYVLILVLALLQAGLGGLLPYLQAEFGLSHTVMSLHLTALATGGLIVGLFTEPARRRFGRPVLLVSAGVLAIVGGILFAAGRTPLVTVPACTVIGVSVGMALVVSQSLLVAKFGGAASRLIGEFNLAYALGAVVAMFGLPFLVASVLGWRGLPVLQTMLLALFVLPWVWRTRDQAPPETAAAAGASDNGWRLRRPWMAFVVMSLCVAVEWSFLFWLATYLVDAAGHTPESAAMVTAVMWGAVVVGRIAGTVLLPRFGATRVLTGSLLLALVATATLLYAEHLGIALLAAVLCGAASANLFPAAITFVVSGYGPRADAAVARVMLYNTSTTIGFPLLLGWGADTLGLRTAFWIVPVVALLALATIRAAGSYRVGADAPPNSLSGSRPVGRPLPIHEEVEN